MTSLPYCFNSSSNKSEWPLSNCNESRTVFNPLISLLACLTKSWRLWHPPMLLEDRRTTCIPFISSTSVFTYCNSRSWKFSSSTALLFIVCKAFEHSLSSYSECEMYWSFFSGSLSITSKSCCFCKLSFNSTLFVVILYLCDIISACNSVNRFLFLNNS